MDTQDLRSRHERARRRFDRRCNRGMEKKNGLFFGLLLCTVGGLLIARQAGAPIPGYLFSWQMALIAVGVFSGIANRFRTFFWIFPILVGTIFLIREYFPGQLMEPYLIPAALIVFGLVIMMRTMRPAPRQVTNTGNAGQEQDPNTFETTGTPNAGMYDGATITDNEFIDESIVFGNVRKVVITKNFKGGEVSTVFASAEINLLQADIQQVPKLELNAVFGSIRLIVPSHWQLKMETSAVLGGIEDKRPRHNIYSDKVLQVEANAVFGGIEIESH